MKSTVLLIISLLIGAHCAHAQWYRVNTNTTENLYDLFFVDSLEGYCVGGSDDWGSPQSKGVILKTTDGGENWTTIFSKDSLMIRNIAIVEINGNRKLYAFGLKDGASYLVSTFVNTTFQNWSLVPISYKPEDIEVYDNKIYFVDETDYLLKCLDVRTLESISSHTVSIFSVNDHGLTYINDGVDSIFYSTNFAPPFTILPPHPTNIFGGDQTTEAKISRKGDTLIIKTTYPGMVLYSFDNSQTWSYHLNAPELKSFIDVNNMFIYSVDGCINTY